MTGVEPVTMPKDNARELYRQYREHCRSKHTPEDRGIMLGYRALAKGHAVIDLYDVFRKCPADAKGLPRLAVGRAHWTVCWHRRDFPSTGAEFRCDRYFGSGRGTNTSKKIWIPGNVMNPACSRYPEVLSRSEVRSGDGRAVVPIIPASIRPKTSLERYHILWEADWEVVPRDPLLLRLIHGSMYAVLAQWDMTELERMVLSHRL